MSGANLDDRATEAQERYISLFFAASAGSAAAAEKLAEAAQDYLQAAREVGAFGTLDQAAQFLSIEIEGLT